MGWILEHQLPITPDKILQSKLDVQGLFTFPLQLPPPKKNISRTLAQQIWSVLNAAVQSTVLTP